MTHGGGDILPYTGIRPEIAADAYIAPGAKVIGDVVVGAGSSVWFNCVLRGDVHEIRVGAGSNIQDGTVVHVTHEQYGTYLGDHVLIGHKAILHGCRLEDRAFVGMGSVVMDGCVIEPDGMLAAGALLPPGKRIGAGEMWKGWPAKFARTLSEDEIADLREGPPHYAKLAATYLREARAS